MVWLGGKAVKNCLARRKIRKKMVWLVGKADKNGLARRKSI